MFVNLRVVDGVALRKESVDRNTPVSLFDLPGCVSLSARRAWIEIRRFRASLSAVLVALRKESVDRNTLCLLFRLVAGVALRKESVDRNKYVVQCRKMLGGRSPQGERG